MSLRSDLAGLPKEMQMAAAAAFAVAGLTWGHPPAVTAVEAAVNADGVTFGGWLLALVPVMFSYSGWNAASYVAEEIRHPERFVPRSLAVGTGAVVALYLLLNVLYVYSLPVSELAGLRGSVMDVIAERLFGRFHQGQLV